jgi:hypothetical protein
VPVQDIIHNKYKRQKKTIAWWLLLIGF